MNDQFSKDISGQVGRSEKNEKPSAQYQQEKNLNPVFSFDNFQKEFDRIFTDHVIISRNCVHKNSGIIK